MFQRDYVLNEARKFAQLLARLMGLKAECKFEEYNFELGETLQKEYDTDLETILWLPEEDFAGAMKLTDYSAEKLNALSQFLYLAAYPLTTNTETMLTLKKVLIIFDMLEQKYHYQSFENIDKRNIIYHYFNNYAQSNLEKTFITLSA
jgi:hypothetical protein